MELKRSVLSNVLNDFEQLTSKPESFVSVKDNLSKEIKQFLKHTYDITKSEEEKSLKSNALPELIIYNFDEEQIFQQLELQNDSLLSNCISTISKLAVAKDRLIFKELDKDIPYDKQSEISKSSDEERGTDDDDKVSQDSNEDDIADDVEIDDECSENETTDDESSAKHKKKIKSSVVDDKFFKLNEMNDFLKSQEKENSQKKISDDSDSENDNIDMFQASESEAEENDTNGNDKLKNPRYKDFFRKRSSAQDKMNDFIRNIDDTGYMEAVKSNLELREERLKRKIDEIEETAVSEKPWQLKGEVTGENRPLNSLLEEVLEFDLTTRPAPVITEETTYILEDVIKQRIKDKVFDDVERKQKPVDAPLEFKKKLILDQEKSKESLAQIYEKEYIKQREALNTSQSEKEEIEPKLHQEIKSMMHSLFTKLDTLSNFHFTPKPIVPELRVVNNLPAISMEEVAPVASTDAALLAPEEVRPKINGDIIGKSERTKTDKTRERRKKKQKQREHAQENKKKENSVKKLRAGLGNKYSKEKIKNMLDRVSKETNVDKMNQSHDKKIKSSSAFFSQLQDNVTSQIKLQTKSRSNKTNTQKHAKRFKL